MNLFFKSLLLLSFSGVSAHAGDAVEYKINGQDYEGYYTALSRGAPLVLILHDWDGLTDYEIKRSEMLAEEGYAVFAADLFGKGVRPTELKDKREHTGELFRDRKKLRRLMEGALMAAAMNGADTENVVVMGYCFGGAAALEYARAGFDAKGIVTFHGGLGTPEGQNYENVKGELLILHGTADTLITMNDFARLAAELETAEVPHEMISYGGAPHSFTVFDTEAHHQTADKRSWERFLEFLKEKIPVKK